MELSLLLPVLMIFVFGIIDFGLGMRSYISLANGVREGARIAAIGTPAGSPSDCDGITQNTVHGRICSSVNNLDLNQVSTDVSYPNGFAAGNSVVVSADYTHDFVTPLADIIGFFSGGSFPTAIQLHSSTDMRLE